MTIEQLRPGQVQPLVRSLGACPDPVDLFASFTDGGLRTHTLLLESADTTTKQGEKSLLLTSCALYIVCRDRTVEVFALNPNGRSLLPWLHESLGPDVRWLQEGGALTITYPEPPRGSEQTRLAAPSPVDVLRAVACGPQPIGVGQTRLGPLLAGVFAYDFVAAYEALPPCRRDLIGWPDYEFWLGDQMIQVNHQQRTSAVICSVFGGEWAAPSYYDATEAIARLSQAIETPSKGPGRPAAGNSCGAAEVRTGEVAVDMDDEAYMLMVERMKKHIIAGDVIQIVPSRTFSTPCTRPLAAYRRLRQINPSPYMFLVNSPSGLLFGASPETAVRVGGTPQRIEIRPIAGTRPRGLHPDGSVDADLDSRLEAELRLDVKEVAEHMMLVDLARNDVARVSEPGSRRVDRLLTVDRYSHVMHLVSSVSGELRPELDALGAYVATMNMGTLVGAPKIKAAELLRRYETNRRGPYGGAVGYVTTEGELDSCIVIRSAIVRDGVAHVRAGAGVVYDSDPAAEARETRSKAEAVLQAIREVQQ